MPAVQVLGVSVSGSVESLTVEQYEQLQELLTDIQRILDQTELSPNQLVAVSAVLDEALLIITK
jgi:hypothetical protein